MTSSRIYYDSLFAPEDKPWVFHCANCGNRSVWSDPGQALILGCGLIGCAESNLEEKDDV